MLNCKDASRLESQAQDRALTFRERIGLRLHLWICSGCRNFARQLQLIRRACRQIEESEGMRGRGEELSPQAKARILQELASKQGEDH